MKVRNIAPIAAIENQRRGFPMTKKELTHLRKKKRALEEIARLTDDKDTKGIARRYLLRVKKVLKISQELERNVFKEKKKSHILER